MDDTSLPQLFLLTTRQFIEVDARRHVLLNITTILLVFRSCGWIAAHVRLYTLDYTFEISHKIFHKDGQKQLESPGYAQQMVDYEEKPREQGGRRKTEGISQN